MRALPASGTGGRHREYGLVPATAAPAWSTASPRGVGAGVATRASRAAAPRDRSTAHGAADGVRRGRDGLPLRRARRRHDHLCGRRAVRRLHARHGVRLGGHRRRPEEGRGGRRAPGLHALPGPDAPTCPPGRGAAAGRADLAASRAGRAVVDRRVPPAVGAAVHRRRLRRGAGRGRHAEDGGQHRHPGDQTGRGPGADDGDRAAPLRACPLGRAGPAAGAAAARVQPSGAARRPRCGHRPHPRRAVPAGHLPLAGRRTNRRGRGAGTAAGVGLGQVAAARAVRGAGGRRGRQPAGLRHDARAGGRARRRAVRTAPARPGGQAADHRRAPGGGVGRRRGGAHLPVARGGPARHHRDRPVRCGAP